MQEILVIEDHDDINELLCKMLSKNGFGAQPAYSGTEGISCLKNGSYALVLLDLMLPGKSGEEVLKEIRKDYDIPVIIISAKGGMDEKVALLENGADDYITKPFDVREVMARIRLQLKKTSWGSTGRLLCGELEICPDNREIRVCGKLLNLTRQEYNILHLLFLNPNKVFTKQALYEGAWQEYYIGEDKTINVHISNIRNKIKQYTDKSYIETVWGIGYRAGKGE